MKNENCNYTINTTIGTPANGNYIQSEMVSKCPHLLPCGVCTRTNSICPLNGWNLSEWTSYGSTIKE